MARVTVEDCIDKVENRFDLVLLASHRARTISSGSQITIERDNDKNPVVALREIADETIPIDQMRENLIKGMQKLVEVDEPEEEEMDEAAARELAAAEGELAGVPAEEEDGEEDDELLPEGDELDVESEAEAGGEPERDAE